MPATTETAARTSIVETALAMSRCGLSPGRSGNVSCRWKSGMLITPSGLPYEQTEPGDIVAVSARGVAAKGARKPSSEWRFHLATYKARPDAGAVVHTHSLNATALACAGKSIPAFHYMVAVAGGTGIPCVPYATFGTPELARYVARGLTNRRACLLAHHGQIATGADLAAALELAKEVETLAAQYIKVATIGEVRVLDDDEMAAVLKRFAVYGAG